MKDKVIGGSINGPHLIHIKVTHTGKKSQLQQIINLVKESQVNKAPVQNSLIILLLDLSLCIVIGNIYIYTLDDNLFYYPSR